MQAGFTFAGKGSCGKGRKFIRHFTSISPGIDQNPLQVWKLVEALFMNEQNNTNTYHEQRSSRLHLAAMRAYAK
jgi:hypothetical protein